MAFKVETKDCTALSDSELSELADLCVDGLSGFDIGYLSKQRDEWVLVSQVREGSKIRGYAMSTLERIGGTPAVLIGLASVARHSRADAVLRVLMAEQYRRALLAFPDEDVLVGTRFADPAGLAAFAGLDDVVPSPGHRASGEERAWGRRLAKRFGCDSRLDDRTFMLAGDGSTFGHIDFDSVKAQAKLVPAVASLFDTLDTGRGDCMVAFGWAMTEALAAGRIA